MLGSKSGTEHGSKANGGRSLASKGPIPLYMGKASWAGPGVADRVSPELRSPHKFVVLMQAWVKP